MAPHRLTFALQLLVTLACAAFLLVPALASLLAGVTVNYFQGVRSGLTLRWIDEVLALYSSTIGLSIAIALGTLAVTLAIGVPAAWALARKPSRLSRLVEEVVTLPVAIPGLALALALLLAYGGIREFRMSPLFILVGHVLYTLPFMLRSVMAVLAAVDVKALEEGAASLGASPLQRFLHVVVPNAKGGILAGALMVVTLSIGEFNLTWMLHTPLTKTLPVGLADSYASMRLEIASAYTLIFFVLIVPLLVALQMFGRPLVDAPVKGARP
ncbi:ABC transporter permease subunit [Xanthobacter sp. KR7-225]|uniref:ABC transporter permease n=1 Tax=Xanthobacter sp. KR7-225 TaxID=3156613 RepID=UPI0032B3C2FA